MFYYSVDLTIYTLIIKSDKTIIKNQNKEDKMCDKNYSILSVVTMSQFCVLNSSNLFIKRLSGAFFNKEQLI